MKKTLLHVVFPRQFKFASKEDLSFFCSSKITFSMLIESGKSALLTLSVMSGDQEYTDNLPSSVKHSKYDEVVAALSNLNLSD